MVDVSKGVRDLLDLVAVLRDDVTAKDVEIANLRAAINDALTAPFSDPELNSTWHQEPIGPNETPKEAVKRLVSVRAEWAVYKNNCENPVIAELRAALATARMELEQVASQIDCQCSKRVLVLGELKELGSIYAQNVCPCDRPCLAVLAAELRAAAGDARPSEEIIREDRDAWPDHQANDPIRAAAAKKENQS